jgi:hypothetical protein
MSAITATPVTILYRTPVDHFVPATLVRRYIDSDACWSMFREMRSQRGAV